MKNRILITGIACIAVLLMSLAADVPTFPMKALTDLEGKVWGGKMVQFNHQIGEKTTDSVELTVTRPNPKEDIWNWEYHFPGKEGFDHSTNIEWKKKGKILTNQQVVESSITKTGNFRIVALENSEEKEFRHIYHISPFYFSHEVATLRKENDQFIPHWKYEFTRE